MRSNTQVNHSTPCIHDRFVMTCFYFNVRILLNNFFSSIGRQLQLQLQLQLLHSLTDRGHLGQRGQPAGQPSGLEQQLHGPLLLHSAALGN
jgi:hypothetical protein